MATIIAREALRGDLPPALDLTGYYESVDRHGVMQDWIRLDTTDHRWQLKHCLSLCLVGASGLELVGWATVWQAAGRSDDRYVATLTYGPAGEPQHADTAPDGHVPAVERWCQEQGYLA